MAEFYSSSLKTSFYLNIYNNRHSGMIMFVSSSSSPLLSYSEAPREQQEQKERESSILFQTTLILHPCEF